MSESQQVRIEWPLYGGSFTTSDPGLTLPFVLPTELVEVQEGKLLRVLEAAPDRTVPQCPHFGACGGCQYQHIKDSAQFRMKGTILKSILEQAGITSLPRLMYHVAPRALGALLPTAGPFVYRNRIRLRIERVEGTLRFGYNRRATTDFLPIVTCPISVPNLIPTVEALLSLPNTDKDAAYWLNATAELELFTSQDLARTQLTFFVAARTKVPHGSFTRFLNTLQQRVPHIVGAAAEAFDPRTGPTGRTLAEHGTPGLNYAVNGETYWVSRGSFFQVNRFLIGTLVDLVTDGRSGSIAWDLFAGVGLFSRILARSFAQVTAVEASPSASGDLRAALTKLGPQHRAIRQTTLDFLREAVTQRERPDLIVLDPPRAGAGLEACALLARIAAPQIVYVSCDPTTLARDLAALQSTGYRVNEIYLIDLFPQTFHLETIAVLTRTN
jgi:23S rRNA (uracil1939-C5)-methyltransferase